MKNPNDTINQQIVEDHGGILTIRSGGKKRSWNGIHYPLSPFPRNK